MKNWERLATRLLEKEYAAVQAEIKEQQKLYIERRQQYMDIVMQDHNDEMTRFNLQRQKNAVAAVQAVDNKFLRCYSAMVKMFSLDATMSFIIKLPKILILCRSSTSRFLIS